MIRKIDRTNLYQSSIDKTTQDLPKIYMKQVGLLLNIYNLNRLMKVVETIELWAQDPISKEGGSSRCKNHSTTKSQIVTIIYPVSGGTHYQPNSTKFPTSGNLSGLLNRVRSC